MKSIKRQAKWLKWVRDFFESRDVLEVQTPLLQHHSISDVYIDSISLQANSAINATTKKKPTTYYLHTSPELAMKSLLAKGCSDIYQICQCFRDNEQGQYNQNEFSLLEWYRIGFSDKQLIDEVLSLLKLFLPNAKVTSFSYSDVFFKFIGIDVLNSDINQLKEVAQTHQLYDDYEYIEDLQIALFVHLIEPKLATYPISVVYDYPKQQGALAAVERGVAKRFEIYIEGIEIANGYKELTNPLDYRHCFLQDKAKRQELGKVVDTIDEAFLDSISRGLPDCAGVALGLSRLFFMLNKKRM